MVEVTEAMVKEILKTLPIGYYLGATTPVVLDMTARTSYVSLIEKVIHVAFNNIKSQLAKAPDGMSVENAIRDQLYHELSHLILTPQGLTPTDEINIVEDERIETLLRDTFIGVDFRRSIKLLCGYTEGWKPQDAIGFLFGICRFREGPQDLIDELNALINTYRGVKFNSDEYDARKYEFSAKEFISHVKARWYASHKEEAKSAVKDAAEKMKRLAEDAESKCSSGGCGQYIAEAAKEAADLAEKSQQDELSNTVRDNYTNNAKCGANYADRHAEFIADGDNNVEEFKAAASKLKNELDALSKISKAEKENVSIPGGRGREPCPPMSAVDVEGVCAEVGEEFKNHTDTGIASRLERLAIRASRKLGTRSGSQCGYTGRINPRAVGTRNDYRWLERPADNGERLHDRVHIRLWADNSGSFWKSLPMLNNLVAALVDVERKLPQILKVSVMTMGNVNVIHDKTREITDGGGNNFGPHIEECDKRTHVSGWREVNVCVWDGDMLPSYTLDSDGRTMAEHGFAVLNNSRTIIVSDHENKVYLDADCPLARRVYIGKNYAERFVNETISALERMI